MKSNRERIVTAAQARLDAHREAVEKELQSKEPGEIVTLARKFAHRLPWGRIKALRGNLVELARHEIGLQRRERGL